MLAGPFRRRADGRSGSAPPATGTGLRTPAMPGWGRATEVSVPDGGLAAPEPYR